VVEEDMQIMIFKKNIGLFTVNLAFQHSISSVLVSVRIRPLSPSIFSLSFLVVA